MSFLGVGGSAQGRSRSRSRSRSRVKEDDKKVQYQMSGALPGAPVYATVQPSSNPVPGYAGVNFAKPLVPTFSSNKGSFGNAGQQPQQGYATAAPGQYQFTEGQQPQGYTTAAPGPYQYSNAPIRYTSRPVIHPSAITPISDIVDSKEDKERKKKEKEKEREKDRTSSSSPDFRPSRRDFTEKYETMTIEPGQKSSKKNKKKNDSDEDLRAYMDRLPRSVAQPYPDDRYGKMPSAPPGFGKMPSHPTGYGKMPSPPTGYGMPSPPAGNGFEAPEYKPFRKSSRTSFSAPGAYQVDSSDEERPTTNRGHSYGDGVQIRDVAPRSPSPPKSKSKSSKVHRLSTAGLQPDLRAPSPSGIRGRSGHLSVDGGTVHLGGGGGGAMPPPSPMLESYRGTYQSMPGMPSPMIRAHDDFDDFDLNEIVPLDSSEKKKKDKSKDKDKEKSKSSKSSNSLTVMKIGRSSSRNRSRSRSRARSSSPKKKTVSMYEAEQDAKHISSELLRTKPDFRVLTDVLPGLSHDEMIALHAAYKRVAKYQGKGINIAKHIKLKVPGHLRTIAYVTALGRWESEGYWANYWYQSAVSKRELLIESLMGRTNHEIQMIKEHFRDKRYGDSIVKCMDKELKADKFRGAAMQALEANRQEENEIFPQEYVEKDVDTWRSALKGRSGGETAMLNICVTRSDAHLRRCLRVYEREHGGNFAKLALARSENLVGEVLAHILNGVINRAARDAMLLHHALLDLKPRLKDARGSESSEDERSTSKKEKEKQKKKEKEDRKDRYELLVSRLVRFHWDKAHMTRVKHEYKDKFDSYVEDDVEDWLKEGEFREFVLELLQTD